jgi:hypothetical protein
VTNRYGKFLKWHYIAPHAWFYAETNAMKNETERKTVKGNVIRNNLTGKEATIEHRENKAVIVKPLEAESKTETRDNATKAKPEEKPKAKKKTKTKAKAKKKAKAKPEAKKKSPLRKITLSRTTMQLTIPSEARDAMLKFLNIRLEDLKAKRSLTVWDNKQSALVTRVVKAEEGQ